MSARPSVRRAPQRGGLASRLFDHRLGRIIEFGAGTLDEMCGLLLGTVQPFPEATP